MLCEMQSVSSRIWTRVAVSIFSDDNHYTTGTSTICLYIYPSSSTGLDRSSIYKQNLTSSNSEISPTPISEWLPYQGQRIPTIKPDIVVKVYERKKKLSMWYVSSNS